MKTGAAGKMWQVYMVRCSDDSLYTGVTNTLEGRIAVHNSGQGAKYTRSRRPVTLVYAEHAENRGAAQRREHAIKRLSAADKETLVRGFKNAQEKGAVLER